MAIRYHKPDYVFIITIAIIIILGLIILSSAGAVMAYQKFGDSNYYLKRQFFYGILIGLALLIITSRIDYHQWRRFAFPLLLLTILLLISVFIPGLGFGYGGAKRWLNFGGFFIQPTEICKLTFLLYLATWLEKRGRKGISDFSYGFLPFIIILGIITLLIMLQPDLGTMTVIGIISVVTYFVAGANIVHLSLFGLGGIILFAILVKIAPYRVARFTVFLNPTLDPQGIGYHINQALLAIGSGGLLGLGLGHSRQKYNYLPEVTGDSIFAILAEELGFIVSVGLIILFLILLVRGFKIARAAPDIFGKLVATGITVWFTFQAFINIAAMVGVLPLTGIPLPFVSYGSSAIAISLAAVGIMINISRQTKEERESYS